MKITNISVQVKDNNRVSISVDGKYRFSLDVFQLSHTGIRIGNEYTEEQLKEFEDESIFGKLYSRALEYCLMRPHSGKEVKDYLYRKTRPTRLKTGDIRPGVDMFITTRVYDRLFEKGYIDDTKFTQYWVDNRSLTKGASKRKLQAELYAKGVESVIVETALAGSDRSDDDEIQKIIAKKAHRYSDQQKLIAYLARQGFRYDDIKQALQKNSG